MGIAANPSLKMLLTAGKYTDVRQASAPRRSLRTATTGIFVPTVKGSANCLREWFWRELKDGGFLQRYFSREKARTPNAIRHVARLMHGFQQNNKSDFQRKATLPAKLYHRWKDVDPNFFDDDNNLRSLKRDNPDLPVFVGPRQLPSTTNRYRVVKSKVLSLESCVPPPTSDSRLKPQDSPKL